MLQTCEEIIEVDCGLGVGSSHRYGTGIPASLDHYTPLYGFMLLVLGFFSCWPPSNNAAIFAEVSALTLADGFHQLQCCSLPADCLVPRASPPPLRGLASGIWTCCFLD